MSMELAISNIKMAMEAFPNNPDLVKLAVSHCEKLQEPAPKTTGGKRGKSKTVEEPEPQTAEPKGVPSVQFDALPDLPSEKELRKAMCELAAYGKTEDEKKTNRKDAHELVQEITGVKSLSAVPEEKRKELFDAARKALTQLSA